jgi:hypothetical protein
LAKYSQQWVRIERKERASDAVYGQELCACEAGQYDVALRLAQRDQRLGQALDWLPPERREAVGFSRAVEQAEEPQHRQRLLAAFPVALEPFSIGVHGAEGVAALLLGVRLVELDPVALADVAAKGVAQIASYDRQSKRMASDVRRKPLALRLRPLDAEPVEKLRAGFFGQRRQFALRCRCRVSFDVPDPVAGRDNAKAFAGLREALQERAQAIVLELPCERRGRRILQRL